jgi:hypothetical protein|tara:strand:- start:1241 stop:1381 length:141 start_codon:yes stop_codon:yes gene_type:complete
MGLKRDTKGNLAEVNPLRSHIMELIRTVIPVIILIVQIIILIKLFG